jgi:SAM-dependent methyltransferase
MACGAPEFRKLAERSDGIPVIACTTCGHGVVEFFQDDPQALYGDDYFSSQTDSACGYSDYEYTAEHSLAWASALVRLLRPKGSVLDIGCANGGLLKGLGEAYQRFGIELNPAMAEECRSVGISVIASDLLDKSLPQNYAGAFDVAIAIAVFEHIPDFKGSFEAALALLKPDGLLLFDVPVVSDPGGSDVWFRSSLEHIHYPTEKSLQYLFQNVMGLELVGSMIMIQNFGATYVGLTSKSTEAIREAGARFEHLLHAPPAGLTGDEARFRWFLDLIHSANSASEVLALSRHIDSLDLNPLIVRRVFELWTIREERAASIERYLRDVENARDWHAAEVKRRDEVIADMRQRAETQARHLAEVEGLRDWHAVEVTKRDEIIAAMQQHAGNQARQLAELENARDWHAAEVTKRDEIIAAIQQVAESREREIEHLRQLKLHQEQVIASREFRIRELQASWSWKLTAPLRSLGRNIGMQ